MRNHFHRPPVRQGVTALLRQAIIEGVLAPGANLTERQLADALGVSRVPVREALRKLEQEDLITVVHGKGVKVANIDFQAVREEYEIRALLEPFAAVAACDRAREEDLARLVELTTQMSAAFRQRDFRTAAKRNADFHEYLVKLCGNRTLVRIVGGLWAGLRFALVVFDRTPEADAVDAALEQDHWNLIDALRQRDKERVRQVVASHIEASFRLQCRVYEQWRLKLRSEEARDSNLLSGLRGLADA